MTQLPLDDEVAESSRWRRWLVVAIAAGLAAVLLGGPVLQLVDRANPQIADNGLEVCGADYCVVQDAVNGAGYGATMARLTMTRLSAEGAQALADELAAVLDVDPVPVVVVAELEGPTAGSYDPARRTIAVERPPNAWVVTHEMAHVRSSGHGDAFVTTLLDLVAHLERP